MFIIFNLYNMNDKNIIIGKDSKINGTYHLVASDNSKIIIGKYCAIANGL